VSQCEFLKTVIPLPAIAEQGRIVSLVRATDRDIGLVREQLNTLKTQKKGLMQKLLTGQVRVKLLEGANDG
jgi:type I restriction enzyme, S subunit